MKKHILSALIISAMCIFASCGDKTPGESSVNPTESSDAPVEVTAGTQPRPTAAPEDKKSPKDFGFDDEQMFNDLLGKWEANIIMGNPEYHGVTAAVFNQWEFFDDGQCVFYMNSSGAEEDSFRYDSESGYIIIKCGEDDLNFTFENGVLIWIGDDFTMDFSKVETFTKVAEADFNAALGME